MHPHLGAILPLELQFGLAPAVLGFEMLAEGLRGRRPRGCWVTPGLWPTGFLPAHGTPCVVASIAKSVDI